MPISRGRKSYPLGLGWGGQWGPGDPLQPMIPLVTYARCQRISGGSMTVPRE